VKSVKAVKKKEKPHPPPREKKGTVILISSKEAGCRAYQKATKKKEGLRVTGREKRTS